MSSPVPIFGTQDLHDDDGQVIDSFAIEVDNAPDLKPAVTPVPAPEVENPAPATKLLTTSYTLDSTAAPIRVFPDDPNRKGLTIKVVSPTGVATDGIRVASDIGLLSTAGRVFSGQQLSDALMNHTGCIYIVPTGNGGSGNGVSAPIVVEAWAVTV